MKRHPVVVILRAAKRLVTEIGWTTGWFARDGNGAGVWYTDQPARCFCMAGAIGRAAHEIEQTGSHSYEWAMSALARAIDPNDTCAEGVGVIGHFNDARGRTIDEIAARFDAAIAIAEARYPS